MQWHSIHIGTTTPELRQMLARRAEFYFNDDHEKLLELIDRKSGYIIHPSNLVDDFHWPKYKAIRILEEIADAFQLPRVMIRSDHGEASVYMWGKAVASQAWPVIAWEVDGQWTDVPPVPAPAVSYSPVSTPDPVPVPVPVSTPVPAPAPVPRDDLAAAAARALAETKLSKIEAARGLISYGVKELGMTPEAVADALILMSRSESTGLTRATLKAWVSGEQPAAPEPTEDEIEVQYARAKRSGELTITAEEHPELAVGVAVVRELNEARPYQRVDLDEIRAWDQDIRGNIRNPQPEETARAVRESLEGYTGILGVDYVGRIMRRHREEASVEARRSRAMLAGSSL